MLVCIKLLLKCKRCENIWDYRGKNPFCTNCSHCKSTVFIKKSPHIADIWLQEEAKEPHGQQVIKSNEKVLGE